MPTALLAVTAVARPDEQAEHVVLMDTDGRQRTVAGGPSEVDAALIARLGATGKAGEVHPLSGGRWLLGIGDVTDLAALRKAGAALAGALRERARSTGWPSVAVGARGLAGPSRTALVTGLVLGSHQFRVSHQQPPEPGRAELVVTEDELAEATQDVRLASVLAAATALARDLASAPSDLKTPTWLVETAAMLAGELAERAPGLSATVWPVERLAQEGFGGMLAVGGGSVRPPALLRLDWAPTGNTVTGAEYAPGATGSATPRHLVLVGKGITFDTGGISIKPADGMHLMRTDMAGGAAVIASVLAIAELGLPLRVTGLVPAAENHVSGSAYRPGDIVRHYDGTTTEVTNTDAEGRMVLADVIGYAVRELRPDLIIDAATLTGAMKVTLGLRTGGLFATDDELASALLAAGERAGERWWRMPLLEHVDADVDSTIADLRQTPPGPPAVSAALFLRRFTGGLPWAHLDIAGPARCEKPYDEVAAGATGFAARTLVELALGYTNGSTPTGGTSVEGAPVPG